MELPVLALTTISIVMALPLSQSKGQDTRQSDTLQSHATAPTSRPSFSQGISNGAQVVMVTTNEAITVSDEERLAAITRDVVLRKLNPTMHFAPTVFATHRTRHTLYLVSADGQRRRLWTHDETGWPAGSEPPPSEFHPLAVALNGDTFLVVYFESNNVYGEVVRAGRDVKLATRERLGTYLTSASISGPLHDETIEVTIGDNQRVPRKRFRLDVTDAGVNWKCVWDGEK